MCAGEGRGGEEEEEGRRRRRRGGGGGCVIGRDFRLSLLYNKTKQVISCV
jgi:hypothetical protein